MSGFHRGSVESTPARAALRESVCSNWNSMRVVSGSQASMQNRACPAPASKGKYFSLLIGRMYRFSFAVCRNHVVLREIAFNRVSFFEIYYNQLVDNGIIDPRLALGLLGAVLLLLIVQLYYYLGRLRPASPLPQQPGNRPANGTAARIGNRRSPRKFLLFHRTYAAVAAGPAIPPV